MTVDDATLEMEVDTGAAASVISKETYDRLWRRPTKPTLKPIVACYYEHTQEKG